MGVTTVLERLEIAGVSVDVDGSELLLRPSSSVPLSLIPEIRIRKAEIIAAVEGRAPRYEKNVACHNVVSSGERAIEEAEIGRGRRTLACLCDNPIPRLNPQCPLCQSITCAQCDQCTSYRRGWNPGWIEPDMLDMPLPELLGRLRSGQRWLQGKDEEEYTGELFGKMLAVWDEIEVVVRHVHDFKGCIHGNDSSCPEDAPVRCCACVPIPEVNAYE